VSLKNSEQNTLLCESVNEEKNYSGLRATGIQQAFLPRSKELYQLLIQAQTTEME